MATSTRSMVAASLLLLALPSVVGAQITVRIMDEDGGRPLDAVVLLLDASGSPVDSAATVDGVVTMGGGAHATHVVARRSGYLAPEPHALSAEGGFQMVLLWLRSEGAAGSEVRTIASATQGPREMIGRVVDPDGHPLRNVQVILDTTGVALTDPDGTFRISVEDAGQVRLRFRSIGYADAETLIDFERAAPGLFVGVRMDREGIELDPIVVEAVRLTTVLEIDQLRHRVRLGHGRFVTEQSLEDRGYPDLGAVVQSLPGIRMVGGGRTPVFREAIGLMTGYCPPVFYLDGMKMHGGYTDIQRLPSHDIRLIEAYPGAATMPSRFSGSDARCGVIAFWTRRGLEIPVAQAIGLERIGGR